MLASAITHPLRGGSGCAMKSLAELQVRKRSREDVESGAEKQQREYFLRKQMESIRKELGDDDASVVVVLSGGNIDPALLAGVLRSETESYTR